MKHFLIRSIFFSATLFVATIQFISAQSLTYGFEAFDLRAGVSYDGNPLGIAGTETSASGMVFSSDGLKVYIIGTSGDRVYQYNLTTPYNVTSGVSYFVSYNIAAQETFPQDVQFSTDGSKMFVLGTEDGGEVNQYTLSTPYEISTATFDGTPFTVSTGYDVTGMCFNNNGSKMYVTFHSSTKFVRQYDLTNPFDITSGVTIESAGNLGGVVPTGVTFSPTGLMMFITDISSDAVSQYNLTIPFDISGGYGFTTSYSVLTQDDQPTGLALNSDGSRFFVVGRENDRIYQYSINDGGGFTEVVGNEGTVEGSLTISLTGDTFTSAGGVLSTPTDYSISNLPTGLNAVLTVAADGLSAVLTLGGNTSNHYNRHDISSLQFTFNNSAFTTEDAANVTNAVGAESNYGIEFEGDPSITYGYDAFDLNAGSSYDGSSSILSTRVPTPGGMTMSADGTKLIITGGGLEGWIDQYDLNTAFDVTAGITIGSAFELPDRFPSAVKFNANGTRMFALGEEGDRVYQYSLTTAYHVSSAGTPDGNFSVSTQESAPKGLAFSTDGTKMFVIGTSGDDVNQYSLATPFTITSGVTFDGSPFSVSSQETSPSGIVFTDDGLKMFILGVAGDDVNQYRLTYAFDITSGVAYETTFSVGSEDGGPSGLAFSTDGSKMFMVGSSTDDVHQYTIDRGGFKEAVANDGAVEGSLLIRLFGDSFTNAGSTLSTPADYSISNLPSGLIPTLTVAVDGLTANLTLGGNGTLHIEDEDVSSLQFTFNNAAFDIEDAVDITNAISAESNAGISFEDNALITYGSDANEKVAILDGSSFSVSIQETSPEGLTFSSDGSKLFIIGLSSDMVTQYNLSTPFDVSSGSTSNINYDVGGQAGLSTEVEFSTDGMTMFVLGVDDFEINQYSLSTAYDLSSTIAFEGNFGVVSHESTPQGLAFSTNGMKMFITGSGGDEVNQYTLTTSFDITSGVSFDGSPFSVQAQETVPTDVEFSKDGLTMFILGKNGDDVNLYGLQTPFDITSGVTFQGNLSVANEEDSPTGLALNSDGTKMFVIGSTGDDVNQYSIYQGSGFSETVAEDGSVEGSSIINIDGDTFSNAGSVLSTPEDYSISNLPAGLSSTLTVAADGLVAVLTLSGSATSHTDVQDVSSLQFTFQNSAFTNEAVVDIINAVNAESNFEINFEGSPQLVYESDAFDLEAGVTYDGSPYSIASEDGNPGGIAFSTDGMKMFIIGLANDNVNQYSLNTAYDITSSVALDGSFSVVTQEINPTGVQFSADGFKMFVIGASGDDINQYSLSSAFDITSTVMFQGNFSVGTQETTPQDFVFSNDGTKMFVIGSTGDDVNQYTLTSPFDITASVTFDGNPFSIASEESTPGAIAFSGNGMKMFILGLSGDDINQYSLQTSFDATTGVSYETTFSVSSEEITPTGLAFNGDGTKFFIVGQAGDDVNQYSVNSSGFTEALADDGSVDGSLTIQILDDTFTNAGGNLTGSDYSIDNLPSGLNSTLTVAADGLSASLILGGNATSNYDSDDISSLQFTFENSAFTSTVAADVINAVGAESNVGIDFNGLLITWNGTAWSNGSGPTAADDAEINGTFNTSTNGDISAKNLTINTKASITIPNESYIKVAGDLIHNGTILRVESGGSLVTEGDVTGTNFTFERTTTFDENTGRYSIVGAPVSGAAFTTLGTNAIVYGYDETQPYNVSGNEGLDRFKTPAALSQTTLKVGEGYFSAKTGDSNGKISFSGTPNHEVVTFTMTATDHPSNEDALEGFNLVSNPYPCAISYTALLSGNVSDIEGAIYIWDDFDSGNGRGTNADYVVANGIGNVDSRKSGLSKWDDHIRSMQGFFVQAKSGGDLSLEFTDDMKVLAHNTDAGYFRSIDDQVSFKLVMEDSEGNYAETLIGARADAKWETDQFDARLFSQAEVQLYSYIEDQAYAIQGIPDMNNVILPLGVKSQGIGTHTITIGEAKNLSGLQVVLIDHLLNTRVNITQGEQYAFTQVKGVQANRFTVEIKNSVLNVDENVLTDWIVFQNSSGGLVIRANKMEQINAVNLISLSGSISKLPIAQQNDIEWQAKLNHQSGLYLVKVSTDSGEFIHRVILK